MSETIAVYIDGDNTSPRDLDIILNEIKNYGRIIIQRVYCDWSKDNTKLWSFNANNYGIEPIQCVRLNGKNSSDIKLCVDIMEDMFTLPNITLFYIVTSDSDYRHVISKIKLRDKKVYCIGSSQANISLRSSCDRYTKVELLRKCNRSKIEIELVNKNKDKTKSNIVLNKKGKIPLDILEIYQQEIENILDKYNNTNTNVNLSLIKDHLIRKYQFDHREYGYRKMFPFIKDNFSNICNIIRNKSGTTFICGK